MAIDNRTETSLCLLSQLNWLKKNEAPPHSSPNEVYEYDVYSDARFTGQVQPPHWPYAFLNVINTELGAVEAALVLRAAFHNKDNPYLPDWSKTDDTAYHGGWIDDELVALASLCLGARLASGGISRRFSPDDPYGQPARWSRKPKPPFVSKDGGMLPDVRGRHPLEGLNRIESVPHIEPNRYVSLVRSCNLYRDALWISEWDANLAWLLLVSALEAGAKDACSDGGPTKRFINFAMRFMPEPPDSRPEGDALRFAWTECSFKRMLNKVYDYRSRALHEGTPFPAPMLEPPWPRSRVDEAEEEVPLMGSGGSTLGGTWLASDVPINLHTFHYIARRVLLSWWDRELAQRGSNSL